MKYCPICHSTYTDKTLSFCLQDGTKLVSYTKDSSQRETVALPKDEIEADSPTVPFPVKKKKNELEEAGDNKIFSPEEEKLELEEKEGSGKVFSSLLLLLVGVILGAGVYYFWTGVNKPTEILQLPPQSSNPLFTIFEEGRRTVDAEPEKYIAAHANETKNAEGHYLIGRAYLLTGRFGEAKKSFDEAKNFLAEVAAVNSKVLANDIETGLIIANNPYAMEEFKKRINMRKP